MRAAVLDAPGGPAAFRIADLPMPECGPGDVLVRP